MTVHVMMDLETWGTAPGSALRSIGAVTFSPYGERHVEESFYANIDRASCEGLGLTVDPSTVAWWNARSLAATAALGNNQRPLTEVVDRFVSWWVKASGVYVWSNGANFDEVLWRCAAKAAGYVVPWKYWNVRDTRTAWHLARLNPKSMGRLSVEHDALEDARHQAVCVTEAYRRLAIMPAAR